MPIASIQSIDHAGQGVARVGGKVVFIDGALSGEEVAYATLRRKPSYEFARAEQILRPSFLRVEPRCRYFGTCGGCSLQHLDPSAQMAVKQRVLEDSLWHIGRLRPELILPAIHGPAWGYRYRARLAVRDVPKKGGVLVGFHEKRSSFVADMESCEVLPARISSLLKPLRGLIGSLSIRSRVPQVEVAVGEGVAVLVLRILEPLKREDEALLKEFADHHAIQWYLQPKGPESAYPFYPSGGGELCYTLPDFDIVIGFHPTQFTQVNPWINQVLVRRAVALLDPRPGERIADFFCGLGNFALPLARRGAQVAGFEGSPALLEGARANARRNGLAERAEFLEADLFAVDEAWMSQQGRFDKMLIDPPRDGAVEVVKALSLEAPQRIVYVSCNPTTLARDAAVLVHVKGYSLKAVGVANMFPHTAHVETIALFER